MAIITAALTKDHCSNDRCTGEHGIAKHNTVLTLLSCVGVQLLFVSSAAVAQQQNDTRKQSLTPAIEVSSHAYQIKRPQYSGTDDGAALDVTPSLTWLYQRRQLRTRVNIEHQRVWYKDAQRSSYSLNEYDFTNQVAGFDGRLLWSLDASRDHIVRGGGEAGAGIFQDRITNPEGLSQTDRRGTSLQLRNSRHRQAQFGLDLAARAVESKQPEENDFFGNIDNRQQTAAFTTSRAHRFGGLYWRGNANLSQTQRQARADLERRNAQLQLGLPLFSGLAWIVRGSHEYNNIQNSDFTNEYNTAGTGFEWYFGRASRVNITYNTVLNGRDESDFYAADFFLAPTRRTSLAGSLDRRYFGRTAELTGQYNLRFLSMRLSYTDRINTRSFLETELIDLGLFVCPDGTSDIGNCTTLPRADYQPVFGQRILRFTQSEGSLREDVVLNRQGSFAVAYNRNRLSSSLQFSSAEMIYVESDRVDRRHSIGLENSYRLSQFSRIRMNIRAIDYNFGGATGREDRNWLYEVGLSRELSPNSELNMRARHSRRDSSNNNFDYQENRITLSYKYQF